MKLLVITLVCAVLISACNKTPPAETTESLAANPAHLKEVLHQCKQDRAAVGDDTCKAASEAWRRRFMGDGKAQYTPKD